MHTLRRTSGACHPAVDEFLTAIEAHQPGEEVTLGVIRKEREVQVKLRLSESEE